MKHLRKNGESHQPLRSPENNIIKLRRNFPQYSEYEMKKMLSMHPCDVSYECLSQNRECPMKEGCDYWAACNAYKSWLLG